jgi:ABC-type multidrug transport system permease subunit
MADGGHYIQLLFANELKQFNDLLAGKEVSDLQMAAMSVQIKNTIEGLEEQLFPPQIKAVKHQAEVKQKGSQKSFMLYMFPGILFMSLLFSSQGLAQEFWNDKTQGIVSRLLSSPSGLTQYLNGKIIGSVFVYILIALVIGLMGLILLKLPLAKIIVIIGWLILSGLVLFSLMLFICLLMPNKKAASVVTSAMVFPMMMLGGSFFPFDAMPKWMASIGQYLPNGFLLDKFNNWFIDDGALSVLYVPAIIAIVFIALFWIINKTLLPKFAKA